MYYILKNSEFFFIIAQNTCKCKQIIFNYFIKNKWKITKKCENFFPALFFYFWATVLALYREMGREGNPYTSPVSYGVTYTSKSKVNPGQENY